MRTILVTGGAGYIGSIAVKQLLDRGFKVIAVDNLSKGLRELVDNRAVFFKVDLVNKQELNEIFKNNKIDAVMHFAAYKAVGESMKNPAKYSDNIRGLVNLLDVMVKYQVNKIVYSSSAAVYGSPKYVPVDEAHPTNPISYYGYTKKIGEEILEWYSKAYGMNYVALRYFNVAGDGGLGYIDPAAENILPIIMEVVFKKRDRLIVFGEDYETRDGSCIRDYIDVGDLVRAHILALDVNTSEIINLGTSEGLTVKEIIKAVSDAIGKNVEFEIGERREGDPAILVAVNTKAKKILNWEPEKDFKDMVKSSYEAYKKFFA